jgi:hypothetical protein
MRQLLIHTLSGIAVLVFFGSTAYAVQIDSIVFYDGNPLNVQAVIGSGANTAYEVIDMASGPDLAWQYNFDGSLNGWQMLTAIEAGDPNLTVTATYYSSFAEHLVNNFQYGSITGVLNKWDFYTGSYNTGNVSSSDPQGTSWTLSGVGIDDVNITSGEIIGWVDQTKPTPQPVLPETVTTVPEPDSAGIVLVASGTLLRRRRRSPR